MAEILKKQAQLFIDAFPDVDRKSPVIPEGGKIDFYKLIIPVATPKKF